MSDKVEELCNELKLGYGYCLKPIDHQGDHVFPPEMSRPKYTQKEMDAAVKAARADLSRPSPCGQKFADGTPHSMADWKEEYGVPTYATSGLPHATIPMIRHCLICDSEAKLRAEMKDADDRAEASNESVLDDNELLQNKLTALREGLAGLVDKHKLLLMDCLKQIERDDRRGLGSTSAMRARVEMEKNFAHELVALLTPPAASGRCKACSAETVAADESGLCAPCRIVRDGLRASGREYDFGIQLDINPKRESEEGQKS